MATGLYSGVSGLAIGVGLNKGVTGLWSGASGLIAGWGGGFNPLSLFASGEQGAWYDPSDLSTMFQDTAGTTPVTATGQTVARINDKSGRGNHATQATAASRPIYGIEPFGGRRNLLTYTEQFDNAAWSKVSATVATDTGVAPDNTTTADSYIPAAGTVSPEINRSVSGLTIGASYTYSIYLKDTGAGSGWFEVTLLNPTVRSFFDIRNGVKGVGAGSIQSVGNGWYRCSVPTTLSATATVLYVTPRSADGNSGPIVATAVPYAFIWGAQLETGSTATAYQRVTDQWNVTQAGVPSVAYLAFDGTDDFMLTGTITPGIDKAQVFAGVRKLSDAATGLLVESSINYGANDGSFIVLAPDSTLSGYRFGSSGSIRLSNANTTGFAAPITRVLTGLGDISGDRATLRVNGTQVAQNTADQGTGNYLAYPLYIGRRAGTSLPFNGRIYQMLVRFGANLSAATITQTESYTAGKTGIYTVEQLIRLNTLNASGVSYNAYAAADSNGNNYPVTNTVLAADGTPYSVL